MRLWPKSKKNKSNSTKDRIKMATFDLLVEKGYASLSMRDISKRADTALGQLTYYYRTKEALILEVVNEITDKIIDELKQRFEKSNNETIELENLLDQMDEEKQKICIAMINIISQSIYNEKLNKKISEFYEKTMQIIINVYKKTSNNDEISIKENVNQQIETILGKMIIYNLERNA